MARHCTDCDHCSCSGSGRCRKHYKDISDCNPDTCADYITVEDAINREMARRAAKPRRIVRDYDGALADIEANRA